ncbi:MAG: undecaprenyl-diphosphatase UppP [Acidobacteria bacterium]|nr:undecaprenyl-diphosphatase UppP [Acidobacteriota bacterium]
MDILIAIIMGIVQSLTEFFPISSSAHLLLMHHVLNWHGADELAFDVALHAGTTLAILIYFARDLWAIMAAFLTRSRDEKNRRLRRLGLAIFISCLPAGLVGIFFQHYLENELHYPLLTGFNLLIFGIFLYLADHRCVGRRDMTEIGLLDALVIGLFQALAPVPGVSRSGITITGGLLRKLRREEAARFSFLMVSPLILGATMLKMTDLYTDAAKWRLFIGEEWPIYLVGTLASFIAGLLCIRYFLQFLRRYPLDIFVLYRCILGLFVIFWFLVVP